MDKKDLFIPVNEVIDKTVCSNINSHVKEAGKRNDAIKRYFWPNKDGLDNLFIETPRNTLSRPACSSQENIYNESFDSLNKKQSLPKTNYKPKSTTKSFSTKGRHFSDKRCQICKYAIAILLHKKTICSGKAIANEIDKNFINEDKFFSFNHRVRFINQWLRPLNDLTFEGSNEDEKLLGFILSVVYSAKDQFFSMGTIEIISHLTDECLDKVGILGISVTREKIKNILNSCQISLSKSE